MLVGAHMSIAGGVHRAIERADEYGMTALQVFTRSSRTWQAPRLADGDAERFRVTRAASGVRAVVAHATYLANPASPDRNLRERSIRALIDELGRCERLGIPWLILHPGSHRGTNVAAGVRRAGRSIRRVLDATARYAAGILVENAAGQGDCVGAGFDEVAAILDAAERPERTAACLDTCHAFAAGHDLAGRGGWTRMRDALERELGLTSVKVVHVNDSKGPAGCRVDRHEGIGRGEIGIEPFRRLVRDPVLGRLPLILETPKGGKGGEDLDAANLALLRGFARRGRA